MMYEMPYSEAKRKYAKSHFGNPRCEVGNEVWVRETDEKGMHEMPALVIPDITVDEFNGIQDAFEEEFAVYPVEVSEDYETIFVDEKPEDFRIPEIAVFIKEDEKVEYFYVTNVYLIVSDGHFHQPRTGWYYDPENDIVYIFEDYVDSSDDWRDPNDRIWYGLPIRHPYRWWDAIKETGATNIMGVNPQKEEDVLIITSGSDENSSVIDIIPMSRLEKIDYEEGIDYHAITYLDKETGKKYYKFVSYWQGSPDYEAEPCEEYLARQEQERRFREEIREEEEEE